MGSSNPDRASATSIYTHVARLFVPHYPHALHVFQPVLSARPRVFQPCLSASFSPELRADDAVPVLSFSARFSPFQPVLGRRCACPFSLSARPRVFQPCLSASFSPELRADDAVPVLSARPRTTLCLSFQPVHVLSALSFQPCPFSLEIGSFRRELSISWSRIHLTRRSRCIRKM
jgi:hypothetical protein